MLIEFIRFIAWAIIVVPFIVATVFSPFHFLAALTNAALHATRSGDIVAIWISDEYGFAPPSHTIFRSSNRQRLRSSRCPGEASEWPRSE